MTEQNEQLGALERDGGYYIARLERLMDQDQPAVWAMLTEPDRFVEWLAPGEIEPRAGGAARLDFGDSGVVVDSTVTAFDPPRLLEYSWSGPCEPDRPVRWETAPAEGGTALTLTLCIPEGEDVAKSCAGWEAHLMMLLAAIEGVPIKFPFERYMETREAYKAMLDAA